MGRRLRLAAHRHPCGGGDTDTLRSIENAIGGSGNDTIWGDNLANVLSGGAGNDVRGLGLKTFQAVLSATDAGPDAVIRIGNNEITLLGVSKSQLQAYDFLL